MPQVLPTLVFAGLLAGGAPAWAEISQICDRPEVLELAREIFRGEEAHLDLIADTSRETATAQRSVVSCAVTVRVVTYRANDPPNYPTIRFEPRYFRVKRLADGFTLDFGPN